MKWNMMFGALVLSAALTSQSFGFDLLDRMLGMKHSGHGCSSCCEPSCGCESSHEPSCGCESSCCESSCCTPCQQYCCKTPDIFAGLFGGCGCGSHGCGDSCCEASCGCEPSCGCDSGHHG